MCVNVCPAYTCPVPEIMTEYSSQTSDDNKFFLRYKSNSQQSKKKETSRKNKLGFSSSLAAGKDTPNCS